MKKLLLSVVMLVTMISTLSVFADPKETPPPHPKGGKGFTAVNDGKETPPPHPHGGKKLMM